MAENEEKAAPKGPPRILERSLVVTIGAMLAMSPAAILWGAGRLSQVLSTIAKAPEIAMSVSGDANSGGGSGGELTLPDVDLGEPPPVDKLLETQSMPMEAVFRFDVTTDWILANWPRVSAGLADWRLQGYRVPLSTGTGENDLAGALTYYFSPDQAVERITFRGTTGNPNQLIAFLVQHYGFVHRKTNHAGLFLYVVPEPGATNDVRSFLWIRPKQVLHAADRHRRFNVELVLERPRSP